MDLDLENKTIFITGASSGIGAAAAEIFAEEGADVVVSYGANKAGAEQTAQTVREKGRKAWLLPVDLNKPDCINEVIRLLPSEIEGLDGLVLCAGYSLHADLQDISLEEWNRVMSIN